MKRYVRGNAGLKLGSILVALSIWFWVNLTSSRRLHCTIDCPVAYMNKGNLEVLSPPRTVMITVRGTRLALAYELDKVRAFVDLGSISSSAIGGGATVSLRVQNFVPGNLEFCSVLPSSIDVACRPRSLPKGTDGD